MDPEEYVEEHGLKTVNDEGALRTALAGRSHCKESKGSGRLSKVEKKKHLAHLVGQTMKAMKGKANPGMVNETAQRDAEIEK